jgi:hypothetical protein
MGPATLVAMIICTGAALVSHGRWARGLEGLIGAGHTLHGRQGGHGES